MDEVDDNHDDDGGGDGDLYPSIGVGPLQFWTEVRPFDRLEGIRK